jgi:hypothetical protein
MAECQTKSSHVEMVVWGSSQCLDNHDFLNDHNELHCWCNQCNNALLKFLPYSLVVKTLLGSLCASLSSGCRCRCDSVGAGERRRRFRMRLAGPAQCESCCWRQNLKRSGFFEAKVLKQTLWIARTRERETSTVRPQTAVFSPV